MRKKYAVYCLNGPLSKSAYYSSKDVRDGFESNSTFFSQEEFSFVRLFNTVEERIAYTKGIDDSRTIADKDAMFVTHEGYYFEDDTCVNNYDENITDNQTDNCWLKFCRKHYPDYDDSQLVKEDVDLYKFAEGDYNFMSEESLRKISSMKYESKEDIVRELVRLETTIFKTALEEYYKKRYGIEGL